MDIHTDVKASRRAFSLSAGCYVLALAHKVLGSSADVDAAAVSQALVECGLALLGLVMFCNALKPVCSIKLYSIHGSAFLGIGSERKGGGGRRGESFKAYVCSAKR